MFKGGYLKKEDAIINSSPESLKVIYFGYVISENIKIWINEYT